MVKDKLEPVAWPVVLVAVLPGLLLTLSRLNFEWLRPMLPTTILVFVLPALAIPILWWRKREVPVWGLWAGGAMAWLLIYLLAAGITTLLPVRMQTYGWLTMYALELVLAAVLFAILLSRRQLPRSAWAAVGLVALAYVLALVLLGWIYPEEAHRLSTQQHLLGALPGPAEGLFLVALGLLAARRHGVLALLVVLGGYVYIFTDSDYLFGYRQRDWATLQLYLATMCFLFMVVAPVALLRARTKAGRAAGLFVPVIIVLAARLFVPAWVVNLPVNGPGDVMLSVTILMSLVLAWVLYSGMTGASREESANGSEVVLKPG